MPADELRTRILALAESYDSQANRAEWERANAAPQRYVGRAASPGEDRLPGRSAAGAKAVMSPDAQRWEEHHRKEHGFWATVEPWELDDRAPGYVWRQLMEGYCLACGAEAMRDEVHNGVGMVYGPWGCPDCGWSEDPKYDRRRHTTPANVDQYGGLWPVRGKSLRRCDMAAAAFERLYFGTWESDPKGELAHKLLACYEYLTERYDRSICTGRRPGDRRGDVAAPMNSYEMRAINRNAQGLRLELNEIAAKLGVLPELERLRNTTRSRRTYEDDKRTAEESGLLHEELAALTTP